MLQIKKFQFNAFQVNTVLLYDETKECVIIDAACYHESEQKKLIQFIEAESLNPVRLINTHCHIDHILGSNYIGDYFKLAMEMHEDGKVFLENAPEHALTFGFNIEPIRVRLKYIDEESEIKFGTTKLKIIHTPGHADGSICIVNAENKLVVVGDVLFKESIGRTDLPSGDFDLLKESIQNKLFKLPDDYIVIPGHGPETTIGHEKRFNPFVAIN